MLAVTIPSNVASHTLPGSFYLRAAFEDGSESYTDYFVISDTKVEFISPGYGSFYNPAEGDSTHAQWTYYNLDPSATLRLALICDGVLILNVEGTTTVGQGTTDSKTRLSAHLA